ncbi:capsular polysaccharide biosynthesis protein [Marinobacterium sedimentorum]|uniref:capsular polysaccharide biosynthesis protein n=1 Tax=Marinobacterium sedimentorum TaxID=2927804 RepID=UPI0020C69BE1|nr:capsular polysaccharide biosynthesis protein [Marinobacterium sedimentorum]MCP8688675.1 capsular polysaccharide biosynthesis protein [Marinobacterium sedimentorum]
MIGYFSPGIACIPFLDQLLESPSRRIGWNTPGREISQVAGWGLKPTADRARRYAAKKGLPYLSLEDGFLRSLGLGVAGAPLHSLIVDATGIYYDATRPSDLEQLISTADFSTAELARAQACMELLRRYRLSKYNHAPDVQLGSELFAARRGSYDEVAPYSTGAMPPLRTSAEPESFAAGMCPRVRGSCEGEPRVLVVDQTFGDPSIGYGLAEESTFTRMLEAAIAQNPGAEVLVKVHPDVICGKKKGYLLELAQARHCRLIGEDLSPWALLDAVDKVYVVTSQLGFDALMAGKEVHCFGMPFYAGWGLTRDRQKCERRGVQRSLEQVFAAAYLRYCRYINPYTGERCELEDTIALIADQKRMLERLRGDWLGAGFSRWKRSFVPSFLGSAAALRFGRRHPELLECVGSQTAVVSWASALAPEFVSACSIAGVALWRMEDGFVRSVGLGADLVRPLSLVLDSRGIYYDATAPSDLEVLLQETDFAPDLLGRASVLRAKLVALRVSKYNVGTSAPLDLPRNRRLILVPGQVETDASIAKGSPVIKTNLGLLEAVRETNPDAFIIYKPHPDVVGGGRYGDINAARLCDLEIGDVAITDLLDRVDEVHTLSSLSGFEALLRGVKVVTYGMPFYAGWGLTQDRLQCERRTRRLSLEQLVAGTLMLYPVYVDPKTGDQVNAETAIALLAIQRSTAKPDSVKTKAYRLVRNRFLKR